MSCYQVESTEEREARLSQEGDQFRSGRSEYSIKGDEGAKDVLDAAGQTSRGIEAGLSKGPLGDVMKFLMTIIGVGAHIFVAREVAYLFQFAEFEPTWQYYNYIFLAWFVVRLGYGKITESVFDTKRSLKSVNRALLKPLNFLVKQGLYASAFFYTAYLSSGSTNIKDPMQNIAEFLEWFRQMTQ